jgi:alpha-L-fucosidase
VGPDPTGKFHPVAAVYLTRIGAWVNINGEAVHGTSAGPFKSGFSWGYATMREGSLYLIVRDMPSTNTRIRIPALKNKLRGASLISAPESKVAVSTGMENWIVETAGVSKRESFSVIRIAVDGMPEVMPPTK